MSCIYGILGSGFGLYGYFPAISKITNQSIILPVAYQEKFKNRLDITNLLYRVKWVENEQDLLEMVDRLVIARSPHHQEITLNKSLLKSKISHFFLEKPLAHSPKKSLQAVSAIVSAVKDFSINYTLLYTDWFDNLFSNRNDLSTSLTQIEWSFMAHHFQNNLFNWKRFHSQGGAVLRFYGIHVIAMLVFLGYTDALYSCLVGKAPDEPHLWKGTFGGKNLPECEVLIDSLSADPCFKIIDNKEKYVLHLNDPFEISSSSRFISEDRRVNILTKIIREQEKGKIRKVRKTPK